MAAAAAPRPRTMRAVPDDALIYREYVHQVSAGEWGAKSRTARICKVSPQHVINVIERHAPKPVEKPLEYQPAPGEVEYGQTREEVAAELATEALLRQLLEPEVSTVE